MRIARRIFMRALVYPIIESVTRRVTKRINCFCIRLKSFKRFNGVLTLFFSVGNLHFGPPFYTELCPRPLFSYNPKTETHRIFDAFPD